MLHQIAMTLIFGKPLLMYGGLILFIFLLSTATVGFLNFRGIHVIPFKWHPVLAITTITIAVIHGLLGLSLAFNF